MYKRTKIEAEVHPRFLCLEEFMILTGSWKNVGKL